MQQEPLIGHRTTGSVLDDLGRDPQAALKLKLKADLHQQIVKLIRKAGYSPRDLEKILDVPQPRVSELLRGKLGVLGMSKLLYYADKLGSHAEIRLKRGRAAAA
jgi:predicted XRE-type DNA-binding protein